MEGTLMNEPKTEIVDLENKNFTKDITESKLPIKKELPNYWDRDYIIEKIEHIKNHNSKMLILFLWYTGLRVGEAISLKKGDIDFKNYTMRVKWQKNRKYLYRIVPLHPDLKMFLEIYTAPMNLDSLVFPITRQRAWQITEKCLNGNPHRLRHSFAVNWLRCGGNIITLSKILGHSHIQNTMVYLQIVPTDLGRELIKINFR